MAGKGPIKGDRIPIELPFGPKKANRVVLIKRPVADYLGFKFKQLPFYETKNKGTTSAGKDKGARETTKRFKRGSYRLKSWTLIFEKAVKIGDRTVKTVSLPVTNHISVSDVVEYFETRAKGLKIKCLRSPEGRGYPLDIG